jgi:hypothetical protein
LTNTNFISSKHKEDSIPYTLNAWKNTLRYNLQFSIQYVVDRLKLAKKITLRYNWQFC